MLTALKELLKSKNKEMIKQAIELILALGMENDLEKSFKRILYHCDLESLEFSKAFRKKFYRVTENLETDEKLAKACLLALLKATGRLGKSVHSLILSANEYFAEFGLLADLEGIESLTLDGFNTEEIIQIFECAPNLKILKLSIIKTDLLEKMKNNERFLMVLESSIKRKNNTLSKELITHLLELAKIHLTKFESRWINVLREIGILGVTINHKIKEVPFQMIYCPSGEFWRGSEEVGYESPRHRVKITQAFWMGQTQVTQALWQIVMGDNPSRFKGDHLPVEKVNWLECVRFCNKLSELEELTPVYKIEDGEEVNVEWDKEVNGYRLPTEAEWEYAARASTGFTYAGSEDINEVAWYYNNSNKQTHPVGQKNSNNWNMYDFTGNVREWCNDKWNNRAYRKYKKMVEDPCIYTSSPTRRSIRGGSWNDPHYYCYLARRLSSVPSKRYYYLGLRVLRKVDAQ